jgi:septal ring factor EnvC (AmiA/AmiB activator)
MQLLSERLPNSRGDRRVELERRIGKAEGDAAEAQQKIATLTPEVADLEQQIDRAHAALADTDADTSEGE